MAVLSACGAQRERTAPSQVRLGGAIFARSCSGCHTLTGHDTQARGGDLAIAQLSIADIASFVRVMPVRLSRMEVVEVADYVHAVAGRRR